MANQHLWFMIITFLHFSAWKKSIDFQLSPSSKSDQKHDDISKFQDKLN